MLVVSAERTTGVVGATVTAGVTAVVVVGAIVVALVVEGAVVVSVMTAVVAVVAVCAAVVSMVDVGEVEDVPEVGFSVASVTSTFSHCPLTTSSPRRQVHTLFTQMLPPTQTVLGKLQ